MTSAMIALAVIHLLLCAALMVLNAGRHLTLRGAELFVAVMIPVFGPLCLGQHALMRKRGCRAAVLEVEKTDISDETRRSIPTDRNEVTDEVVPLTETVIVNRTGTQRDMVMETLFEMYKLPEGGIDDRERRTMDDVSRAEGGSARREMMLDVLHDDPAGYLAQLMASDENDDPEVTHYAVTALVEIQKSYDIRFQQLARALARAPEDDRLLRENQLLLERYLDSGILDESARRGQLLAYLNVLERRLALNPGRFSLTVRRAGALAELEESEKLKAAAAEMIRLRPENEEGYLFRLRACAMREDRAGIDETLRELKAKNIYLSPGGRSEIGFWTDEQSP